MADQDHAGRVIGLVALGDPVDAGFERLVSALRANALVTSVRVRLVPALRPDAPAARRFPRLTVTLDHFGWPDDLSDAVRRAHLALLARVADEPNVATSIDALGTLFHVWDTDTVRPWLQGVVEVLGAERCMLGSDLPIETLRSSFGSLYAAYDTIFDAYSEDDRRQLFGETARRLYGGHLERVASA